MLRHLLLVGITAIAVAACGSSGATPTPAASTGASNLPVASASTAPGAPSSSASSSSAAPSGGTATMMTVACDLVGVRKQPTTKGAVEGRIHAGSIVRVVATVTGDVYSAGSCGTSGTQWLKIDQVDGKGAKQVYGVDAVYAAAGFFK